MIEETYSEHSVARKRASWVIPAWIGFGLLTALAVYFLICMNFLLTLAAVIAAAAVLILLLRRSSVEYEYLFLLDELTVDRIYRKSFRKPGVNVLMQDVEMICPTEDSDAERMRGSGDSVEYLDYSSHEPGRPTYTIKYAGGGKTHFLCFEPDEKMLRQMRHAHPGKVKLRK